jgi:UPF0042 nucleotide-binding protein
VVTGLSGSGKTAALKALEDIGYFCIDNLPISLLPKFIQLSVLSGEVVNKVGIGMDSREKVFFQRYREAFEEVERLGIATEVVFLDAADEVLLRRFSETRRRHPLAEAGTVDEGIAKERKLFHDLRQRADLVIDTSHKTVHDLKKMVWGHFSHASDQRTLQVNLVSFGFRHGLPHEADVVLDVRFLPNPYFVPEMKALTGLNSVVQQFVLGTEESREVIERFVTLMVDLLPLYEREGKSYLTIAIGCTGGKHRSVTVVEELRRRLSDADGARPIHVNHRDVEK